RFPAAWAGKRNNLGASSGCGTTESGRARPWEAGTMAECAAAAEAGPVCRCPTVLAESGGRRPGRLHAGAGGELDGLFPPEPDGTPGPGAPLGCDHDATLW